MVAPWASKEHAVVRGILDGDELGIVKHVGTKVRRVLTALGCDVASTRGGQDSVLEVCETAHAKDVVDGAFDVDITKEGGAVLGVDGVLIETISHDSIVADISILGIPGRSRSRTNSIHF